MKKKYLSKLSLLFTTGLMLVGCGSATQTASSNDAGNGDTIKIGGNFELSGAASAYGTAESKGVHLAVKLKNEAGGVLGKKIDYIEYDNKSSAEEAATVATRLTDQDNVSVLLGPATSGDFKAQTPIAESSKTPAIGSATTNDDITVDGSGKVYNYVFRTCFQDSFQGKVLAEFSNEKKYDKIAIIKDNSTDYGQKLTDQFKAKYKGTVVDEESYNTGDTDFQAIITKIKATNPDAIFVAGYYQEGGLLIKQLREQGVDVPILGPDGFGSEELVNLAGGADQLNNMFYVSHYDNINLSDKNKAFQEAYEKEYGTAPDMFAALTFDAANLAFDAIERANSANREDITKALAETKDFEGATGTFTMDDSHNPIKSAYIQEVQKGKVVSSTTVKPE